CLIEVVEPAGSDTFAVTKLGGKSVFARLRADTGISPGQNTRLAFNLDKAVFFDPESQDNHDFYAETNRLARELDSTRQ
ncbi:hypothetical protein ACC809_37580, partial [Rhizobium johnstonii]